MFTAADAPSECPAWVHCIPWPEDDPNIEWALIKVGGRARSIVLDPLPLVGCHFVRDSISNLQVG